MLPTGRGRLNEAGLAFYERLVDGLLARGMQPYVTLYHWDLPLPLADAGGWQSRDTAAALADYAALMMRRLGDRVTSWATLNEPRCCAWVGHYEGRHAPGLQGDLRATLAAVHHQLLGHGLAVAAMRAERPSAKLGIVLDLKPHLPASDSPEDAAAAWRGDGVFNRCLLDPLFRGTYPADVAEAFAADMPAVHAGDMATIAAPIDALGINYYTRAVVAHDASRPWPSLVERPVPAGPPLHDGLGRLARRAWRPRCCVCSATTHRPPSTSPKTAPPSPTPWKPTAMCTTPPASTTCAAMCRPAHGRWRKVCRLTPTSRQRRAQACTWPRK